MSLVQKDLVHRLENQPSGQSRFNKEVQVHALAIRLNTEQRMIRTKLGSEAFKLVPMILSFSLCRAVKFKSLLTFNMTLHSEN